VEVELDTGGVLQVVIEYEDEEEEQEEDERHREERRLAQEQRVSKHAS
jgi:hypothetical protein